MEKVRLTQYSHGAGCGCKIAPDVLSQILKTRIEFPNNASLLVGNATRDDAAAYLLAEDKVLISTVDFFMPIVDDPFTFGKIAAANAISDVYAMGATPILAIAVLGWPINLLSPEIAREVLAGGQDTCKEAGIILAGGHSIDCPEPIFGLAVNGITSKDYLKTNAGAKPGDFLFYTKPLGIGILTTAEKKEVLSPEDKGKATNIMVQLNSIGESFGKMPFVHALTDVTGFGLLGHLIEICEASGVRAELELSKLQWITSLDKYIEEKAIPGGTFRNWNSYKHKVSIDEKWVPFLADPQTNGGLLVAVAPEALEQFSVFLKENGLASHSEPIGQLYPFSNDLPVVSVIS
ncbi:MAG: selenide, water dikinase SelD [Bacteroidia bacterium]|nr:selenide, water dikinase SelD [Bacteroidia bacterium]MDW8159766.1 selenide, water dikinase SelD [Bacteroidia bacterium]